MQFSPTRKVQQELFAEVFPTPRNEQLGNAACPRPVLYDQDLSGNQKIVFLTLLDCCKPGSHQAKLSIQKLVKWLGMTDKTVQACIDKLYERGYILSIVQFQGKRDVWYNVYSLRTFAYPASRPRKPRTKRKPIQRKPKLYPKEEQPKLIAEQESSPAPCPLCNGTGWKLVEKDGSSMAAKCSCKTRRG